MSSIEVLGSCQRDADGGGLSGCGDRVVTAGAGTDGNNGCWVRGGWQLFDQYKGGAVPPKELGPSREYNLDLIPKFMMANGKLVQGACRTVRSRASQEERLMTLCSRFRYCHSPLRPRPSARNDVH
jgi:hypothetical protein